MIYLFAGNDVSKKLPAYEEFMGGLSKDLQVFYVNKNSFNPLEIESFYSGRGLFFNKCALVFQNVFEDDEIREQIIKNSARLAESENFFIFLESKLKKEELESFKKSNSEINIFELSKDQMEKYNNFLLSDAFGDRDKVRLWMHYRRAVDLGVGLEELVGVLFWKAKDMLVKRNFYKFKESELKNFATGLAYLLPTARSEGKDAEVVLEKYLLEAF